MISKMDAIRFAIGLETIRTAYRATREGLDERARNAESMTRDRWGLAADEEPSDDPAEDGWSPRGQFWIEVGEVQSESTSAEEAIRQAFIIALFHFWERNANRWCGGLHNYDENKTFEALKAIGRHPEEEGLRLLKLLANCLKHGASPRPSGACNQLHKLYPDLFQLEPVVGERAHQPSDEHLSVPPKLLDDLLTAVLRSGPSLSRNG